MKNAALWERLEGFALDEEGADFRFSERLAQENGWSAEHTQRVVAEYRKFLYLCVVAGHAVTPSDEVDQVWHLHLCYTRSYWQDLCKEVLGFPLHHGPTKGGGAERAKYADWYGKTLERYVEEFDEEAPVDIWPVAGRRFAKRDFRRVDATSHFILRKRTVAGAVGIAGGALLLAGCATHFVAAIPIEMFFIGFVVLFIVIVIAKVSGGGGKGGGGGGFFGGGCGGGTCGGDSGCGGGGCGGGD